MNSFPEQIVDLVIRLAAAAAADGVVRESIGEYFVHGLLDDNSAAALSMIAAGARDEHFAELAIQDRFGETVALEAIASTRGMVDVRFLKPNTRTTYYFFEAQMLMALFADDAAFSAARRVFVARGIEPFKTMQCTFARWEGVAPDDDDVTNPEAVELRMLIADLTPTRRVPSSIGNLLLQDPAPQPSVALQTWKSYAAGTLPCILVNEVRSSKQNDILVLSSPRRVAITASEPASVDSVVLDAELEAARWIYAGGPGVENRFTFFTTELSRSWPGTLSWDPGFRIAGPTALESARAAQRLFLSGKTGEVLKALGDLRKSLSDEVSIVMQQSRDLGSSLWRDFAIAIAALAARVAAGASSATLDLSLGLLLVFVACFLAYSLYVTLKSNARFIEAAGESRKIWTHKIYSFLQEAELKELASEPLAKAESVYWWTAWKVGIAYVVVILILLAVSVSPLLHPNARSSDVSGKASPSTAGPTATQQSSKKTSRRHNQKGAQY